MSDFENIEHALKRAALWIGALVELAEVDPEDVEIGLKAVGRNPDGGERELLDKTINLAADMEAFARLGAQSDFFTSAALAPQDQGRGER